MYKHYMRADVGLLNGEEKVFNGEAGVSVHNAVIGRHDIDVVAGGSHFFFPFRAIDYVKFYREKEFVFVQDGICPGPAEKVVLTAYTEDDCLNIEAEWAAINNAHEAGAEVVLLLDREYPLKEIGSREVEGNPVYYVSFTGYENDAEFTGGNEDSWPAYCEGTI